MVTTRGIIRMVFFPPSPPPNVCLQYVGCLLEEKYLLVIVPEPPMARGEITKRSPSHTLVLSLYNVAWTFLATRHDSLSLSLSIQRQLRHLRVSFFSSRLNYHIISRKILQHKCLLSCLHAKKERKKEFFFFSPNFKGETKKKKKISKNIQTLES